MLTADRCGNLPPHCSGDSICVTSVHMRKWMRERIQRRKKKTAEEGPKSAPPPPLQPAYFMEEQPVTLPGSEGSDAAPMAEPAEGPAEGESEGNEGEKRAESPPSTNKEARGRTTRRRRGGRGRGGGGRGREKAVAQAFAPAAGKGNIPELPTGETEAEAAPDQAVEQGPEIPGEVQSEAQGEAQGEAQAEPAPASPAVPVAVPAAPPRPPKGIVVLAIGLPGSGKSSWFKRHNVVPLSSDMVRSLLFDDIKEQRFQDLVFSNLRSMLKARLIAKRPMNYVDATNLTPQERQHWVKLAKDYNYEVHAVFFDVPLEVCIERHQRRDRVVAEDVMRRMAAKLKPPTFNEGFAKITVVRVKKKEE